MSSYRLVAVIATCACGAHLASGQLAPAWRYAADRITMGSPRLADVDGDGAQDIVLGTMGPVGSPYGAGWVGAFDLDGAFLPGFPIEITAPIVGPVAIGDIDNNGDMEIVATSWSFLWVWNHDGSEYPNFPIPTGTLSGIPPALADLDGNGDLEIICAQGNGLYVYDHTGDVRPGWPVFAPQSFQAPGVGDLDGDGRPEIVAGTWAPQFPDLTPHELYALEADGASMAGFPIGGLGSIRGPVSLGDVDQDGAIEIVARSGDAVYIWTHEGAAEPGWPVTPGGPTRNSATAIGDIDQDGDLEVLLGEYAVHGLHHTGNPVSGWPAPTVATGNINSSPVICDLDGEPGALEVLVKISDHMVGLTAGGVDLPWSPYFVDDRRQSTTFSPSPTVGDADGDGDLEVVFVSIPGEILLFHLDVGFDPARAPWPTAQHDSRNTCFLAPEAGCYADCDGSGALDFFDFLCFQNAFAAGDPYADCDGSGALDFFDFLCFQNAFAAGCP
ncbi:MAG: FG-GAP-like repeat-containing protein [Phycisphaerales bacterium JB039]